MSNINASDGMRNRSSKLPWPSRGAAERFTKTAQLELRERKLRAFILAAIAFVSCLGAASAVVRVPLPNECSDRNALLNVAFDSRLTAVQFYYKGSIQGLTDKDKKACIEAHVIMDDQFAVINKAYALMAKDCLPIDVAARLAAQGVCP